MWVLVMRMGLLILTLVAQPVWWFGFIREWWTANQRIQNERKTFGSAIYADKYELRHYFFWSLGLGILTSVLCFGLGVTVPLGWVVIYMAMALIAVLVGPAAGLPVTILIGSGLVYLGLAKTDWLTPLADDVTRAGLQNRSVELTNLILLFAVAMLLMVLWLRRTGGRFSSPKVFSQKRGKLVAGYRFNELLIVPTLVLVPGDWLTAQLPFWPVLSLGTHTVIPIFLPLLIGFRMTIFKQNPKVALRRLARKLVWVLPLGIVLFGITLWIPNALVPVLLVNYVVFISLVIWTRWYDRHQSFWYSKVDRGVRVLGIKPGTPAAKMNLQVGDIITTCNQVAVNSEREFYEALLINATYCHLRVQTPEGDLKVTETAIFDGAPHEIGIVVFKD